MAAPPFDPTSHRVVPQRGFEDLVVGERFTLSSRTITEANFAAFQTVSSDNHPIHYDIEYCRAHNHENLLAHGLQVLSFTAAGAGLFPHAIGDALVGFIEVQAKFLKAVYAGDTLYPALTITALEPQRTTGLVTMAATVHNQKGELVLDGRHVYLLRLKRD
jgi:acyl dehydratase